MEKCYTRIINLKKMDVAHFRIENCRIDYDNEENVVDQYSAVSYNITYSSKYLKYSFENIFLDENDCEGFVEFYGKVQNKETGSFNNEEIVFAYEDNSFRILQDARDDIMYGFPVETDEHHAALMEQLTILKTKCDEFLGEMENVEKDDEESFKKLSSFVATIVAREAVAREDACPITMEPLVLGKIGVLHCGHCFDAESIKKSLRRCTMCPTCRDESEPCFV
jgi:hypothetical protein